MTVHDHRPLGPRPSAAGLLPSWRWLTACVWWIEHAFERARADGRPEEDTRVRIFMVLAAFGLVFCGLAVDSVLGWQTLAQLVS